MVSAGNVRRLRDQRNSRCHARKPCIQNDAVPQKTVVAAPDRLSGGVTLRREMSRHFVPAQHLRCGGFRQAGRD
jgi:hypothetical protein